MSKLIPLSGNKSAGKFVIVDDDDFDTLNSYSWHISGYGYASRYTGGGRKNASSITMHRQIMNEPNGIGVDHINGNKLDNRKCNLRLASQSQNNMNARPRKNSTSPYKGVYWNEGKNRWTCRLQKENQPVHIGHFLTQRDAALAYNVAALEHFGEFARLNVIINDPADLPVAEPAPPPSSKYIGVTWDKARLLWSAKIQVNKKCINLGRFSGETEAARVRDVASIKYLGDKAKLNFP